jgi:hypothetical protein
MRPFGSENRNSLLVRGEEECSDKKKKTASKPEEDGYTSSDLTVRLGEKVLWTPHTDQMQEEKES